MNAPETAVSWNDLLNHLQAMLAGCDKSVSKLALVYSQQTKRYGNEDAFRKSKGRLYGFLSGVTNAAKELSIGIEKVDRLAGLKLVPEDEPFSRTAHVIEGTHKRLLATFETYTEFSKRKGVLKSDFQEVLDTLEQCQKFVQQQCDLRAASNTKSVSVGGA